MVRSWRGEFGQGNISFTQPKKEKKGGNARGQEQREDINREKSKGVDGDL